jgi:hypothetical protein
LRVLRHGLKPCPDTCLAPLDAFYCGTQFTNCSRVAGWPHVFSTSSIASRCSSGADPSPARSRAWVIQATLLALRFRMARRGGGSLSRVPEVAWQRRYWIPRLRSGFSLAGRDARNTVQPRPGPQSRFAPLRVPRGVDFYHGTSGASDQSRGRRSRHTSTPGASPGVSFLLCRGGAGREPAI